MTRYDTRFDPTHYTARDGRILPVEGTHVLRRVRGELASFDLTNAPCRVCTLAKKSERAERFAVGQHVQWSYGREGTARGQVIGVARSRVQVMWQRKRGPRPIWKRAIDLRLAVLA